jgi:hypothetical protein
MAKSVKLKPNGFPDFSPFVLSVQGRRASFPLPGGLSVLPGKAGSDADFREATKEFRRLLGDPTWTKPADYTWHHNEVLGIMELVPSRINNVAFPHSGGKEIVDLLVSHGLYP